MVLLYPSHSENASIFFDFLLINFCFRLIPSQMVRKALPFARNPSCFPFAQKICTKKEGRMTTGIQPPLIFFYTSALVTRRRRKVITPARQMRPTRKPAQPFCVRPSTMKPASAQLLTVST